jgi:hypothetical protein
MARPPDMEGNCQQLLNKQTRCESWYCFWCCVTLYVVTKVSEERIVSALRLEVAELDRFFRATYVKETDPVAYVGIGYVDSSGFAIVVVVFHLRNEFKHLGYPTLRATNVVWSFLFVYVCRLVMGLLRDWRTCYVDHGEHCLAQLLCFKQILLLVPPRCNS